MPKNITQYDLLISCPGDVFDEVNIITEVVANFNQQFSNSLGIAIQPRHWSKSSYPQSGDKPQNLLNEQFVKDCDAAVAIFWTRFGTPTDEYKSGSEEEIEIMLDAGKQVFLYFCEKPVKPGYDDKQYQLVQAFKEKYASKGIYSVYDSNESFKELFNAHLTKHFLTVKTIDAIQSETKPKLSVKSISQDGGIVDSAIVQKYIVPNPMSDDKRMESIREKIAIINKIHFKKEVPVASRLAPNSAFLTAMTTLRGTAIKIDDITEKKIFEFAKVKNITLSSDFFDLGDLYDDISAMALSSLSGGGRSVLKGTEAEKQKYYTIQELEREIEDYVLWNEIENTFSNLFMIKLVVENAGNTYDEDIDIEVIFPLSMIITHDKLPKVDYFVFKSFSENYGFLDIFSISQTEKYADYDSSVEKRKGADSPFVPSFVEEGNWLENNYQTNLNETFCYKIFKKENNCIVKLHMDYIKQHIIVAFPTPLFINNDQLTDKIAYRIISKNNPDIVSDYLELQA